MYPSPDSSSNASSSIPPEESTKKIAAQLEQSILNDIQAVNDRNWGPGSPLFYRKASYWIAEVTAALSLKTMTVDEFVGAVQRVCKEHPNYKVRAVDFTTTVDEQAGTAEIFANVETSGLWEGVAQRNVTICEYHRIDGKWYHTAHRTMPGLDVNIP